MRRLQAGCHRPRSAVTREILQSDPRNVGALLRQADALMSMGQPDAAEECYRRVLEIDPRSGRWPAWPGSRLIWRKARRARPRLHSARLSAPPRTMRRRSMIWASRSICRIGTTRRRPPISLPWRTSQAMTAAQVNMGLSLALAGATDRALAHAAPAGERSDGRRQGPTGSGGGVDAGWRRSSGAASCCRPICRRTRHRPRWPAMPR